MDIDVADSDLLFGVYGEVEVLLSHSCFHVVLCPKGAAPALMSRPPETVELDRALTGS